MCDGKTGFEKAKTIGLIDNELCTRSNHSFPNLAIMKLSSYYKSKGCNVKLINFDEINQNTLFNSSFDVVFVSKVFSDTETPLFIDNMPNVHKGGSGFYYDLATPLHYDIEHCMPDYGLYDSIPSCKHSYYKDYSIGFLTRGCVRQCSFCINRNSKKVEHHANIEEFYDPKRPYIMLLDDNITAYKGFYDVFDTLDNMNVQFVFKQGMDFRLLNERKMQRLWRSNYYEHSKRKMISAKTFHFAFDNIADYELIERKLKIYYNTKPYSFKVFFYVLTGFDRDNNYNNKFYRQDIIDMLKRIELLYKYNAYAYIMLHENYKMNPEKWVIQKIKNICNNPAYVTNKTMLQAFQQKREFKLIEWMNDNYPSFLELRFNSKLPDRAKRGGKF